ncbi:cytochrome b/b6 domain-containing protein [Nitrospirillum amazonense]|uniref:cytochrome b/b6 domain-containing protein n=1 Tax=Nitrospirillum amazonense TaxID=28077 RepID=UPI0024129B6D|nr:cytochrome b/b6 domain-containing protein [Nitrospirillum amazonense]MDG3444293.1 cytochrome b/b6 domain-containing protein [Nitrospirillum amazonense]
MTMPITSDGASTHSVPKGAVSPDAAVPTGTVRVWDPAIRILHWTIAASFAIAWLSAEEIMPVHEAAGFVILVAVGVRSLWGLVGTPHARFAEFVPSPKGFLSYMGALVKGRAGRYVGHNPAGGAMIVALLASLLLTVATGIVLDTGGGVLGEDAMEDIHGAAATVTLILVALHIGGVILSSMLHRENLVRAMVTGRKRA